MTMKYIYASASIGIIGGADGPTAITVAGPDDGTLIFAIIAAIVVIVAAAALIYVKNKGKKE